MDDVRVLDHDEAQNIETDNTLISFQVFKSTYLCTVILSYHVSSGKIFNPTCATLGSHTNHIMFLSV